VPPLESKLPALRRRAELLTRTRAFFAARELLEVETPLLGAGGIADEALAPFSTCLEGAAGGPRKLYLQTSPEVFMKRLLAADSGPVWQLTRAFRNGEVGPRHNPEFTILEWYRPGWDPGQLMDEVEALFHELVPGRPRARRVAYAEAFARACGGLDPHRASAGHLEEACRDLGVSVPPGMPGEDPAPWRDLLVAERVEPALAEGPPTFLVDFPAGPAALAARRPEAPSLEDRFELYDGGLELANGFRELTDPAEQRQRFSEINARRQGAGLPELALDEAFLGVLASMPPTSGVAVGFDRVVMRALGCEQLGEVWAFPLGEL